jgi:ACS family hexuronate transporter-like MFS transporter
MLVTTINYIDRACLGVAGPIINKDLNINLQQFSYIIIGFQFCYMIMQPISGRIIDFLNIRRGFALAAAWWSIANILHAFARSPLTFGLFRGLLGVGEAGNFPGIAKTASEWFPPRERTMATGIANIGSGTGTLIAFPFVAWIILKWGWQAAFVITGAIGFFWVILWALLYRAPEKHPMITPQELAHIQQGQKELDVEESVHEKGVWKVVFKQRNFLGIAIARFLSEPAWQFFTYFIPLYLMQQRGMDLKQIGMFAWIPFLAADLGSFVGGILSPFYQKLGLSVLNARRASMTTGALLMPFALLITAAPTAKGAVFWFCFGAFGHNCISATLLTLPADLFPKRTVATANGMSGCIGYFGGMLFIWTVGWFATNVGYGPIFTMIAFLDIIGAIALWTILRVPKAQPNMQTV